MCRLTRINNLMDISNSLLEIHLQLYLRLHRDVAGANASVITTEYAHDVSTIETRARMEGMSFFTKTLPRLGKAIDFALSNSSSLQFSSFKRRKGTELPAFCGWLFSLVFSSDGRERSDACAWHLKQLRQLMFVFYKLELEYDEDTIRKACVASRTADEELSPYKMVTDTSGKPKFWPILHGRESLIAQHARTLCHQVLGDLDLRDIVPRHGPGSVSTGEKTYEKRDFRRIYRKLEAEYPFTEYFAYNLSHVADSWDQYASLETLESGTTKVVFVPKDSRGPRLISCEPLENQWIQQGQMRKMVAHLEHHPFTSGHVNFTDQEVNRQLSLDGSRYGKYATIDMKEASDRVAFELVKYLFPGDVFALLDASRSTHMKYPDGTVIQMNKFAPMGSANCFPVEALVFWALCVAVVHCTRDISLNKARESIFVYGDDIICSSEDHAAIRLYLPLFGLKVNDDKCCTGKTYKESCGMDAYKGIDVTPTKCSTVWCPTKLPTRVARRHFPFIKKREMPSLDAGTLASWVAYSNAFHEAGYCGLALYIEEEIQKITSVPYFNTGDHDGIGFVREHIDTKKTNTELGVKFRYNTKLQRSELRGWGIRTSSMRTFECGWAEMVRVQSYSNPSVHTNYEEIPQLWEFDDDGRVLIKDSRHPVRAGRYTLRRRNSLKRLWIPAL